MKPFLIFASFVLVFSPALVIGADNQDITFSDYINNVISSENDENLRNDIIEIASGIQDTYADLYNKTSSGTKIKIFIDPAHGKVKNNGHMEWQGALTWRKSTSGLPEEMYSIPIARKFYKLVSNNPHLEITSFPDYMEMLNGKSDTYTDVTFDESVDAAYKSGSFLIVSEHLNNISPLSKADGFVNIPGLHITCNQWRTPFLSYVSGVYHGYYTYYNLYDITGTSRKIGEEFRRNMIYRGHTPNNWESGIVGDDRFSLYINFPISVIFESGFISNPIEEELLRKDSFQDDIAQSQYNAVIASIRSKFGVDLSNEKPDKIRNQNDTETNIITLSRFFVYYTQKGEFNKAISILNRIEKFRNTSNTEITSSSYSVLRNRIKAISSFVSKARILTSRKKYSKARVQYTKAINTMKYHPLFSNIREKIYEEHNVCARNTGSRQIHYSYRIPNYDVFPPELTSYRAKIENHSVYTPYVITIADNQSLDEAVELSMSPNNDIKQKIVSSLRNSSIRKATYKKFYSRKKRRYVYSKVWVKSKPVFSPGMYIVSFSKSFLLKSVTRVPSIIFDPNKYQNQQFFKNSCLAEKTKEKSL